MIEFRNVSRHFGEVVANDSVSFQVEKGSIHGIVGENGAGKSTAMNMLFGLFPPTSGEISVRGKSVSFASPSDAVAERIGMVHQHFMLADALSVEDNLLLGHEAQASRPGFLPLPLRVFKRRQFRKKINDRAKELSFEIPSKALVEKVSVGVQQRIEILKLLLSESEVLILDEPTAVLTPQEVEEFLQELKRFKKLGKTVLIITHKLKEVLSVCDRVTVFRSGKVVDTVSVAETSFDALSEMMVGRKISFQYEAKPKEATQKPVLKIEEVSFRKLQKLSLQVSPGEILGIAGVEGNGQSDLIDLILFGKENRREITGNAEVFQKPLRSFSPKQLRKNGLGYLPQDRLNEGVLPNRPLWENYYLGKTSKLNISKEKHFSREAIKKFQVKASNELSLLSELSGGNQQKFVVARELSRNPKLLIAAQPTRGVDLGAIQLIHEQLLAFRNQGAAVLLISSELDELLKLSDRVSVLFRGEKTLELDRKNFNEQLIGQAMAGKK